VSKDDLKDVFTGNATTLKEGPANEEFLKAYVDKGDTPPTGRSLVFSGQASMPKSLDDDAAAVAFIAHNPGTIGYIDKASPHDGVKVLDVH
jgi:hypothetical protein